VIAVRSARLAGVVMQLVLALCGNALVPRALAAESDALLERRVKAAFLYQFIPYVDWPSGAHAPDAPIVIAVVGDDSVASELTTVIGGRTAKNRPVVVRRWRESDLQGGVAIVYVRREESARLPAIARAAQQTATLVVSEHEAALKQGSMINFQIAEGRVRFDVALAPVEAAGLRISSRLLAVARDVRTN
jgi:hypothetical protein